MENRLLPAGRGPTLFEKSLAKTLRRHGYTDTVGGWSLLFRGWKTKRGARGAFLRCYGGVENLSESDIIKSKIIDARIMDER